MDVEYVSVGDFYSGKSVFITGGTGFLGKVIIEKLLYSCPNLDKVFLLIREKREVKPAERLASIIDNSLFERLKEEQPQVLDKLVVIPGDILQKNLGLTPEHESLLIKKVSVVFHVAASVRLNQLLEDALKSNFEGTEKVLNLCKRMERIEALIHISTAYTQCDKNIIEEIIYPAPADINVVYKEVEQNKGRRGNANLLNGLPNTYTFTKALTETMIANSHGSIPTVIIRPSIVTPIIDGPVKGWLDNWYGATTICTSVAKGLNRSIWGPGKNIVDLIPVDYVTNCCIVSGARISKSNGVSVYNCCSSSSNPLTLSTLIDTFVKEAVKHKTCGPFPELYILPKYKFIVTIVTILFQIIPAYVMDFFRNLFGKSSRYVKIQASISLVRETYELFSSSSWIIKNDQVRSLYSSLSSDDKVLYPMDPNEIDWNTYLPIYCAGVRKFLK